MGGMIIDNSVFDEVGVERNMPYFSAVIPTGERARWEAEFVHYNKSKLMYELGITESQFARFDKVMVALGKLESEGQTKQEVCQCLGTRIVWQNNEVDFGVDVMRMVDLLAISQVFDDVAMKDYFGHTLATIADKDGAVPMTWECYECNGMGEGRRLPSKISERPDSAEELAEQLRHAGFSALTIATTKIQSWEGILHNLGGSDFSWHEAGVAMISLLEASDYDSRMMDLHLGVVPLKFSNMLESCINDARIGGKRTRRAERMIAFILVIATRGSSIALPPDMEILLSVIRDEAKLSALLEHINAHVGRFYAHESSILPQLLDFLENGIDAELGASLLKRPEIVSSSFS